MQLIVTSAWTPHAPLPASDLAARRSRLLKSLAFYGSCRSGFSRIVILDATVDVAGEHAIREVLGDLACVPLLKTEPKGDYRGPSYLEALLYLAADEAFEAIEDDDTVFKVSGGYIVRNMADIAERYERNRMEMLGYLHQNPIRFEPRYAMTSCLGLDGWRWREFRLYLAKHLDAARDQPLEGLYADYLLKSGCSRGQSMPYPRLDAWFSTGALSSRSWRYRLRETAWRLYARGGAFVLSRRREGR